MATVGYPSQPKPSDPQAARVGEDVDALRADIAKLASSVSSLASSKVGSAMGDAQSKAEQTMAQMERSIRRNPTQATMIAVGVGFVVGLLLSR
jgi:ElaB/YqjD/DUF883 family membrane-anchored ribosome-binding protein